jgi:hypothetical protein
MASYSTRASLTVRVLLVRAMQVCADRLCSAVDDASSFDVLLTLQTLRIAIHRRKGVTLKF